MGEVKRRRTAKQIRRHNFAPDFGIAMWNIGHRDTNIHVYMSLRVVTRYEDFTEATGMIYLDHERYCVTVNTLQKPDEIFALRDEDDMVLASGRLSDEVFIGDSGEPYRLLTGCIENLSPADRAAVVTRGDVTAALTEELLAILRRCTALSSERPRVVEIGRELNALGGWNAMHDAYDTIKRRYPYGEGGEDGWHPCELGPAWDGIGKWLN